MIVRAPDAQTEGLPFVIVAEKKASTSRTDNLFWFVHLVDEYKKSQDTHCPDYHYQNYITKVYNGQENVDSTSKRKLSHTCS